MCVWLYRLEGVTAPAGNRQLSIKADTAQLAWFYLRSTDISSDVGTAFMLSFYELIGLAFILYGI